MTMDLRETEKFWQDLMPPGVTCSDEGFGNWLERVQNALDHAPDAYNVAGNTFTANCCSAIVDRLDTLRKGFELRQINLLREMVLRGAGDVDAALNMALSIHQSLAADRVRAFKEVLDAFDKRHNGSGTKILADFIMVSCGYTKADQAFFVIHLAGKDIVKAGGFRKRLSETGDPRFVLYMMTGGVDPFDRAFLNWQRSFTPKTNDDEKLLGIWRQRCEAHPDWAVAQAQLAAIEHTATPWKAGDFLQAVNDEGLRVIDVAALSGKAANILRADRWTGRFEDFKVVVAALEETLATLPVDMAVVSAKIQNVALQQRKKPTVRFGK